MKSIFKYIFLIAALIAINTACENEPVGPILKDSSTFVAPELMNPATSDPMVLSPDNALDLYEEFEWTKAEYGVQLPTNYILAVDLSEEFKSPVSLGSGAINALEVTVEEFNNALLKLGIAGFTEATVKIRTLSIVTGGDVDTLHSASITRTVTTYQDSDCGDYCTIGLIGSATPGDWGTDTDMRILDSERIDLNTWTLTVFLKGGQEVKFRANDGWDVNWGSGDFPSGTATPGGPNIPIPSDGYYKIVFNDITGDYTFTPAGAKVFTTIGLIGDATPGGWGEDTDLTQDANDVHLWTGTITINDGEAKFRAENDWADNWGDETYPSGYAFGGGPNIPVKAGTYFIWFNDASGEYAFMNAPDKDPYDAIGIIGDATPGGWGEDTDLIQNPSNPYRWSLIINLADGETKFRANNAWDVNWGGVGFPSGIGSKGGPNIPVNEGIYTIHFHTGTGEYTYLK